MNVETPKMPFKEFYLHQFEQVRRNAIKVLKYVGEQCVNEMRNRGSYTDRTRNLRGSTGYIIVEDGRIIEQSSFTPVKNGTDEGPHKGQSFAKELAGTYPKGLVLIVVAGMNYAAYVQDKGYNVTSSAEALAEKQIPRLLYRLKP